MNSFWQDLRYGARQLARNPGFTVVAVLTLALGIGATTAIFSLVNAVLLRPLPFKDSEQLVMVWNRYSTLARAAASPPDFLDRQERSRTLAQSAVYTKDNFNLLAGSEPDRIRGAHVSANLISLLGVSPLLGRAFSADEGEPGRNRVVVLGHGLWQRRFGGDPEVLGKPLSLNGESHMIVGIMPPSFWFPDRSAELWVPIAFTPEQKSDDARGNEYLYMVGRMNTGTSLPQVQAEMDTIAASVLERVPSRRDYLSGAGWGATVVPLLDQMVGDVRPALWLLFGAVGFLLLIACANIANLFLVRAISRRHELALRSVFGASRWRLARQLLTESLLLAALGGFLGFLILLWGLDLFRTFLGGTLPRLEESRADLWAFSFALALSLLSGTLFGLAPAWQGSRRDMQESLNDRSGLGRRSARGLRSLLVVGEVGLALVLLSGAGLLLRSFDQIRRVDPGFQVDHRLTFRLSLPAASYPERLQREQFFRALRQRLEALPGVRHAGITHLLPFSDHSDTLSLRVEGREPAPGGSPFGGEYRIVSPGYFASMGIPLIDGREFTETDTPARPSVIVVNKKAARTFWPGEPAVGKRVRFGSDMWREVVGVVGSIKNNGLDEQAKEQIYLPYTQYTPNEMALVVHTDGPPAQIVPAIRSAVSALDPRLPVFDVSLLGDRVQGSLTRRGFWLTLFGFFAAAALLLAALGVYGVIAHSVNQRRQEIGLRMAVGAQPRDILTFVLRQGFALTLAGIVLGLGGALAFTRFLASLLFNTTPTDPLTFVGVSLLLAGVALLACYLPARRAMRVDPMTALRYE